MSAPVLKPTVTGDSKLASRYALRVKPDTGSPVVVFGVSNFAPTPAYTTQDNSDYDSDGWGSDVVTQRKLQITGTFQDKTYGGTQDPGQGLLQAASEGNPPELIVVQWFDRDPDSEDAWEADVYVQWIPQGGAVTDLATINFTLMVQGAPRKITNPMAAA